MSFKAYSQTDINVHSKYILDMKWNSDGSYIASLSADNSLKINQIDASTAAAKVVQVMPIQKVYDYGLLCWHPTENNKISVVGDTNKYIEFWDVKARNANAKLLSGGGAICCSWSPCGNLFATGTRNDVVNVFDIRTMKSLAKQKFYYEINDISWTANSDYIICTTGGGEDVGCIDLLSFEGEQLNLVDTLTAHATNCYQLCIDSDFKRMAIGSSDYTVSFWDLDELVCYNSVQLENDIKSISFSGDGQHIAISSSSESCFIVDTNTTEVVAKVPYMKKLSSVAWHPTQNVIALAIDDQRTSLHQFLRLISFQ
eukprot:gene9553-12866_t